MLAPANSWPHEVTVWVGREGWEKMTGRAASKTWPARRCPHRREGVGENLMPIREANPSPGWLWRASGVVHNRAKAIR